MPSPKPLHLPWAPNFSHPKPPGMISDPGVSLLTLRHASSPGDVGSQYGSDPKAVSSIPTGRTPPVATACVCAAAVVPADHWLTPMMPRKNGFHEVLALTTTPAAPVGIDPPPTLTSAAPAAST